MTHQETSLTRERLWPVFMRMRLAVAVVLFGLQLLVNFWVPHPMWSMVAMCNIHAVLCGITLLLPPSWTTQRTYWSWGLTIGMDVLVFAVLQVLQRGNTLNYALLFALPVLMAASLGAKRLSLAVAASATLLLLFDTARVGLDVDIAFNDLTPRLFQAAITGTAFFLVALLAYQLAVRLAREEAHAEKSQQAALSQALVNQLVIETLSMGVLVVDGRGLVRTANPAARRLLGDAHGPAPMSFLLASRPYCVGLAELVQATFAQQHEQLSDLTLESCPDWRQRVQVRTRLTLAQADDASDASALCVLFIEDRLELEAQLRTEKLAAMGRMSVAVAHEIRNPLSAIAHANGLLQEDLNDPLQRRLSAMIDTHTKRLNRIVDDVLNVVRVPSRPVAPGSVPPIELDPVVRRIFEEWCGQHACTLRVALDAHAHVLGRDQVVRPAQTVFDPEHLRRVLVNLLDNAARYASQQAKAIQVSTAVEGDKLCVSVWSDGRPLEATVQRHLFEPFFSSESRSSGLGLYLCRELCERYGANLHHRRSVRRHIEGNDFYVLMPMWSASPAPCVSPMSAVASVSSVPSVPSVATVSTASSVFNS